MLGNDIVDLTLAEAQGKAAHRRFLERVFTPTEITHIDGDCDPTALLWALFAAKEAVFKAVKKQAHHQVLAPRSIEISMARGGTGTAVAGHRRARLRWERQASFVHCVAWLGEGLWPSVETQVGTVPAEEASCRLREWTQQRLIASGWTGAQIRRDEGRAPWRPPRVYHHGSVLPEIEISFSHDGSYAALAYLTSSNSTSNISVALGGMTPPAPRSP